MGGEEVVVDHRAWMGLGVAVGVCFAERLSSPGRGGVVCRGRSSME